MNPITRKLNNWQETDTAMLAKWSIFPLMIMLAWLASQLFWKIGGLFVPQQISTTILGSATASANAEIQTNIENLLQQHIFGNAGKIAVAVPVQQPDVEDVPETRLNLKLRGIYASDDDARSNAIIETANGLQDLYFINDAIPGERNLSLHSVLIDRIILKRQGKLETLKMEDLSAGLISSQSGPTNKLSIKSKLIDRRNNRQLTKQLSKIKQQMIDNPASLAGLMNISPKTVDGEFIGFQIAPGKDASLFARSGLRRNDIITNVNGISLDDPSAVVTLMEEIRNADELNIQLTRGNKPLSLVYNLNDNKK